MKENYHNDTTYHSNGKLLLTGEYVVLDGARALAVPTRYGQSLTVYRTDTPLLVWKSFDYNKRLWFETSVNLEALKDNNYHDSVLVSLIAILKAAKALNPEFLHGDFGYKVETYLDFPNTWGLGTSSTLINNIAQWANVDPYKLLEASFGGSGYDIACAQHNTPIIYRVNRTESITIRTVTPVDFSPKFIDHLYFVYLNKKQNSREGILAYKNVKANLLKAIPEINEVTESIQACSDFDRFCKLLDHHEYIISKLINQSTVKTIYFNDSKFSMKSLGAWGGDFILVAAKDDPKPYFAAKGFDTVIKYSDMVLQKKDLIDNKAS